MGQEKDGWEKGTARGGIGILRWGHGIQRPLPSSPPFNPLHPPHQNTAWVPDHRVGAHVDLVDVDGKDGVGPGAELVHVGPRLRPQLRPCGSGGIADDRTRYFEMSGKTGNVQSPNGFSKVKNKGSGGSGLGFPV